jgi:ABC-type sugar transport system permease subunit
MSQRPWKAVEERRAYWSMVSPAVILYVFVFGFPIIISIVISLSNYAGGKMFGGESWRITGFQQYIKLARDPYFWLALKNNVYIVLISVFGQLPLGLIFAYLIYRRIVRFGEFWQGILYMPAIISVIVIGIMWNIIFSPYGLIAEVVNRSYAAGFSRQVDRIFAEAGGFRVTDEVAKQLIAAGGPNATHIFADPVAELKALLSHYSPDQFAVIKQDLVNLLARKWSPAFLAKRDIAMLPILFVVLWMWTGMYLILFLANMQRIDSGIVEAARIDGASEGQIIWRIMLPMLSGVVVNAAILCIAGSLNSFELVFAMTGGGPARVTQLLSIYMYDRAFMGAPDYPLANAIALAIVIFSLVLIMLTKVVERRYGGRE